MNFRAFIMGGRGAASPAGDFGLLALRAFAGLSLAFAHGIGKLPPADRFVSSLRGLGMPAPEVFAYLAGLAEFGGGLLLALGLMTRPAAFFAAVTMSVAAFGRHAADPFARKELALLYLAILIAFMLIGAGRYSVDGFLGGSGGGGKKKGSG